MATYRLLAYDIIETFKQKGDDSELRLPQVVYWIQVIADRLRAKDIEKDGDAIGRYLSTFDSITVDTDAKGRKYIDLPEGIYQMPLDQAVEYIAYNFVTGDCDGPNYAYKPFSRTSVRNIQRVYMGTYEKPSPDNPYFYVKGSKGYLLGIETVTVNNVQVGLYLAMKPSDVVDWDTEVPLDPSQIEILKYRVMNLGRYVYVIPNERDNDGANVKSINTGIPTAKTQEDQQNEEQ